MEKASIYTIAQRAGVSTATVSRALSGKGGLSDATRRHILDIARELNYRPNSLARRLSASEMTIGVFYIGSQLREFGLEMLCGAYAAGKELADYNIKVRLIYIPGLTSGNIACMNDKYLAALKDVIDSGINGVVNFPMPSNRRQHEFFSNLFAERDIPMAGSWMGTVNVPDMLFSYSGDIYTAGAMAAELLWNMLGDNARVCIQTAQKDSFVHSAGIRGFRDALENFPLELVDVYENHDDTQMAYYVTDAILRNYPDVQGMFVGSANSSMVCRRISECEHPEKICLVTSDLYPELAQYIEKRIVRATIIQSQYHQTYEAVKTLADYLMSHKPPAQTARMERPQIVMRSNMRRFLEEYESSKSEDVMQHIEIIE